MEEEKKYRKIMPDIIRAINETDDIENVEYYENIMVSIFAAPLMLMASIAAYIMRYILWQEPLKIALTESAIYFLLAIMFELISRLSIKVKTTTYIVSALYSTWFFFSAVRYYERMDFAVIMTAILLLVIAMVRISDVMLNFIGFTCLLAGIYIWLITLRNGGPVNYLNIVVQSGLFIIVMIVTLTVHKINVFRFRKMDNQLKAVLRQKLEISELYDEIAASEEELRQQNNQLMVYNAEIKQNEDRLNYLAYFDTLTELPNRKMVMEQLEMLIPLSAIKKAGFYVILIDTDDFKKVNDTLGHYIGDLFIKAAADRLKESIYEEDLLGRIGGDEFALIIQRELNKENVFAFIEKVRENFGKPFHIENVEIRMTASFGISVFPEDGDEAVELIKSADTSMYKAKEQGKNIAMFFKQEMKDEIIRKIRMEKRLLSAMENEEFFLVFQPQFHINGEIVGFEALLRWKTEDLGYVSPLKFIPLAEETGLIVPLGEWVLKKACSEFKKLRDKYKLDAFVSVNISTVQMQEKQFTEMVNNALNHTGINANQLELEITESVFIKSFYQTVLTLKELKKMGIRIALDDFGTGYSSLNYLRMLPIDTLKIDKSFIKDLLDEGPHKQIVGDIISLAHNLNLTVVAEGVEVSRQFDYLKNYNCDRIQGFLLGKPLGMEQLEELIDAAPGIFKYL